MIISKLKRQCHSKGKAVKCYVLPSAKVTMSIIIVKYRNDDIDK